MYVCVWAFVHFSNGQPVWANQRLRPWHVILLHPFTKDPPHHHTVPRGPTLEVRCTRRYRMSMASPFDVWCRRLLLLWLIPNKNKVSRVGGQCSGDACCFPMFILSFLPSRLDTTLCSWRWMMMLAAPAVAVRLLRLMVAVSCVAEIPVWYPRSVK